jgi:hypothetical protein
LIPHQPLAIGDDKRFHMDDKRIFLPFFTFATKIQLFPLVNADEQRIESACSGDITRSRLGNYIDLVVENEESLFGRIGSAKIS